MFDKLLEKIRRVDEIESKLLSIFEGKSWEHIAKALYRILDDIDTTDDVCKENVEAFRNVVMGLQAKKNRFLASYDGYTITRVDEELEVGKVYSTKKGAKIRIKDIETHRPSGKVLVTFFDSALGDTFTLNQEHLLPHLQLEVDECVCHIYGLSDEKLLEFYGSMGDDWNAFNEPYGSDKAEVEAEIEKRGLDVNVDEKKFRMVGGIGSSVRQFFNHKACGKDKEYLINFAISRFGESKLSEVLCNEVRDQDLRAAVETLVRNELDADPDIPTEELFQNVLDGVKEEIRDDVERVLPQVYNKVLHHHFESTLKEDLTGHARRELELAGMFDKEVEGSEAAGSWNILCAEAVMELMEVFAEQGHSGFSASMTQDLFSRLARYEKLTELTDNLDEWNDVSEFAAQEVLHQSLRSPSCFSEDRGKTYWDIDEDYFIHEDEDGNRWSGGLSKEEYANRPMHQSKHIEKEE